MILEKYDWRKYHEEKKENILKQITPLLNSANITDFEYIVTYRTNDEKEVPRETLRIGDTYIGCTSNSEDAVFLEALNYMWVRIYARQRNIGAFKKQTINVLTEYWRNTL